MSSEIQFSVLAMNYSLIFFTYNKFFIGGQGHEMRGNATIYDWESLCIKFYQDTVNFKTLSSVDFFKI